MTNLDREQACNYIRIVIQSLGIAQRMGPLDVIDPTRIVTSRRQLNSALELLGEKPEDLEKSRP